MPSLSASARTASRSASACGGAAKRGFIGTVDLADLEAQRSGCASAIREPTAAHGDRFLELRGPGVSVSVHDVGVQVHVTEDALCLARGPASFRLEDAARLARSSGPAHAWLMLYRMFGQAAFQDVGGRYSVVIVDAARRCVLFGTDRFAVWPLCYAVEGTCVFFSDQAHNVPVPWRRTLDPQAVFDFFYFHVIPAPRTVFQRIHRLEGGVSLQVDVAGIRTCPSWTPQVDQCDSRDVAALTQPFRLLLRESVAREVDTDRIGAFLSGGTDSSTVAGLLGEAIGRPAKTFSIGFDADGYDEMSYARIAARHFGTEHHEYYLQPHDIVEGLPDLAAHFDQPFGNSSALPTYFCAMLAAREGVEKLLAGDGGDELFGGNTRYARQRVFEAYHRIPRLIRSGLVEPVVANKLLAAMPIAGKLASYVQQARIDMPDRLATYNLVERLGTEEVFTNDFLRLVNPNDPAQQQRTVYHRYPATALIDRMLALDWKYTLSDNDLVKVSGATALAGVAVGYPLLSDELVDFAIRLPPKMKLNGLRLRYFFKEALRDFLPAEIIRKKKHGFGLPFGPWLVKHVGLREMARESLRELGHRNIVRADFLTELFPHKVELHPGYFGEMVWLLIVLEQWLAVHAPDAQIE